MALIRPPSWILLLVLEMIHALWNTIALVLVAATATAMLVAVMDIGAASVDATRVLMKDMGFNLLITPGAADAARWQALDYSGPDMPDSYVKRLSESPRIMAQHFVGKLQQTMQVNGCTVVLTGVQAEVVRRGTEKKPMPTAYRVPEGRVYLGAAAAPALNKKAGDSLELMGKTFQVDQVLPEQGLIPDDIRIYMTLQEAQALLNRPGRVNAIDALACQCPANAKDIVGMVRDSIQAVLPDVKVQPYYSLLLARHEQRVMMQRVRMAALFAVMVAAAACIWGLVYQNVTARRQELGVFRALGVSDGRIAALFLGKAAVCGAMGGLIGVSSGHGFFLAMQPAQAAEIAAAPWMLALAAASAPVAAVLFALPPVVSRLRREAAEMLGDGAP